MSDQPVLVTNTQHWSITLVHVLTAPATIQGFLVVLFGFVVAYLSINARTIPDIIGLTLSGIVGFYFGNKPASPYVPPASSSNQSQTGANAQSSPAITSSPSPAGLNVATYSAYFQRLRDLALFPAVRLPFALMVLILMVVSHAG